MWALLNIQTNDIIKTSDLPGRSDGTIPSDLSQNLRWVEIEKQPVPSFDSRLEYISVSEELSDNKWVISYAKNRLPKQQIKDYLYGLCIRKIEAKLPPVSQRRLFADIIYKLVAVVYLNHPKENYSASVIESLSEWQWLVQLEQKRDELLAKAEDETLTSEDINSWV